MACQEMRALREGTYLTSMSLDPIHLGSVAVFGLDSEKAAGHLSMFAELCDDV